MRSSERSAWASASIFFFEKKKNAAGTRFFARSQEMRARHCAASVRTGAALEELFEEEAAAAELACARAREPAARD